MPRAAKQLEWCTVRLGEDSNWWVVEVSDDVHWDVDGLSIVDPRQISHILDLLEPLQEYKLDQDLFDSAFLPFRIQRNLGDGLIRLTRSQESFADAEEPLFGLPNIVDDENSPYADFINHITKIRVAMLNDLIDFEQKLTIDEVEDDIREEENNNFIEGRAVHLFNEVTNILDYVPAGWELDDDDSASKSDGEEDFEDLPEIEEEDTSEISKDESLKWDEDDEDEDDSDDTYEGPPPDDDDDDDLGDDEEEDEDEDK
ncbi:hypothetical protein [Pelagicoccus sp. SDUM812005]|uniref:hypothetical protein n=1 Tax=Pelagicoccus sp. SDUM812005 TaxID=3041257 RepID=UPI00280D3943|nr:hypothetical protein [Pelagicoccus sp. SDUM812005]MDQ8182902.1 hypothetical protein [Pelagicoccus sp. SDUM812005]